MTEIEPFWKAADQVARLSELTSHDSELKEAPLRPDVRSLGRLPGEVPKEQATLCESSVFYGLTLHLGQCFKGGWTWRLKLQ